MGARAVEGTGLENRQGFTPLVGSNPTPSANTSANDPKGTFTEPFDLAHLDSPAHGEGNAQPNQTSDGHRADGTGFK